MLGWSYPVDDGEDGKAAPPRSEGERGSGVGSWIALDLGETRTVTRIQVSAGDWSSRGRSVSSR